MVYVPIDDYGYVWTVLHTQSGNLQKPILSHVDSSQQSVSLLHPTVDSFHCSYLQGLGAFKGTDWTTSISKSHIESISDKFQHMRAHRGERVT